MKIEKRIKVLRKSLKMTQNDLARAIGAGKGTVSRWERGLRKPLLNSLHKLIAVAEINNVKINRDDWLG